MAETVRTADYFYVMVPDKPGEGARVLGELRSAGVNLVAYSGFPSGRGAQLDVVPTDPAAFKTVAKQRKWKVKGPKRAFLIEGDDRVGACADVLGRLAARARPGVSEPQAPFSGHLRPEPSSWHPVQSTSSTRTRTCISRTSPAT